MDLQSILFLQWIRLVGCYQPCSFTMRELQAFVLSIWEFKSVTWPARLDNFNNTFPVQLQLIFWCDARYSLSPLTLGNPDNPGQLPWLCSRVVPAFRTACPWQQDLLQLKTVSSIVISSLPLCKPRPLTRGSNVNAMQRLQGTSLSSLWVRECLEWRKSWRSR